MKKNKKFTVEQYRINLEKGLKSREKKLYKKLKKCIYDLGMKEIEICYEARKEIERTNILNILRLQFPFLNITLNDYTIYICIANDYYEDRENKLNDEIKSLNQKLEEQVRLKNINGNKVFELQEKNEKLEMKILNLESKIEGIKNYAKHIGEISYEEYDKNNLAKKENSYYLRDDIEINESLYYDLADLYCYLGMNDMVRGFKEYENKTRKE